MPRVPALAALAILAAGSAAPALAADWKPFTAPAANGARWFYDADYSYRDAATGRVVVMQAIGKPEAKVGPNGPGAADGVGSVVALDCKASNLLVVASYSPKETPDLTSTAWREGKPKKVGKENAEDAALMAAACAGADGLPSK
ncbi:MAG: hypothetical protein IT546_17085 [Caulobacteraceae bacterium]|nr:hypothetical protein [Caulobacteraceae bacterium]